MNGGDATVLHSASGVSAFTGEPFVLLTWGARSGQMSPDEARTLGLHIIAAADAAETDAIVVGLLGGAEAQIARELIRSIRTARGHQ